VKLPLSAHEIILLKGCLLEKSRQQEAKVHNGFEREESISSDKGNTVCFTLKDGGEVRVYLDSRVPRLSQRHVSHVLFDNFQFLE
jgi:hypothetical protein